MTRISLLSSPLLLGFEDMERLIDRVGKGGNDGYPPYNIERITGAGTNGGSGAVEVLSIRGRQVDDKSRQYIHRGIAARQFSRTFVLADGIEVRSADLSDGLLSIDLARREPGRSVRKIEIGKSQP